MTRDANSWSTPRMLLVCAILFVVCAAIFLTVPEIDLWVANLFYNGNNDFWLRKTLFNAWSNAYLRPAVGFVAVGGLILFLIRLFTIPMTRVRSLARYGFFLLCIALSTGLVVHAVFKDNWGRARPKHVTQFDGEQMFTPPLLIADECARNCSFVSGDASLGFVTLALALYATRRRNRWILVTVGAGLGLGLLRMMNGSHFFSDILFSGIFTCGTVLLLYRWIEEKQWLHDTAWFRDLVARALNDRPVGDVIRSGWHRIQPRFQALFRDD